MKKLNEFSRKDLELAWNHILCVGSFEKGFIVVDDPSCEMLEATKEQLKYFDLERYDKVSEISIDDSWPLNHAEEDFDRCWNKLIRAAHKTNNGLLVINISNIRMFEGRYIWCLKQLAKQESEDIFFFHGYVLLNIKDIPWEDIKKHATDSNKGEFEAMMQFYRRIRWDEE